MALVLCVLFCSGMLNRTIQQCGRKNVTVLAMADGKPLYCEFLDIIQNLLKCGRYCTTTCQGCCSFVVYVYGVCSLASPLYIRSDLPMVIDWTPTTGLIPCQVEQGPAWAIAPHQQAVVTEGME